MSDLKIGHGRPVQNQQIPPNTHVLGVKMPPHAPARLAMAFSVLTPAGRAIDLVNELCRDHRISSADRDVLVNVLMPIARQEYVEIKP